MKKAIVFLCFFGGAACFISAGLYINKNNAGMINTTQESVQKVKSPELLSDINMTQYVSLPASFSDIDIVEDLDNIEVTEDNVNDIIYDKLLSTATHLSTASDDGILLMVDYTVTKNGAVVDTQTNFKLGYNQDSELYDEKFHDALKDVAIGTPVHIEDVFFNGNENATVDLTVTNIYNMPYPVTDNYIGENTEYQRFQW